MDAQARRLLQPSSPSTTPPRSHESLNTLNANVIDFLALLLCAVFCALAASTLARLALRLRYCLRRASVDPGLAGRLKWKAIEELPALVYRAGLDLPECAICLTEFAPGDGVRVLPECSHGFHVGCVDRWLVLRASCPTCRRGLFSACAAVLNRPRCVVMPINCESSDGLSPPEGVSADNGVASQVDDAGWL